ncbi:hypothetical protein ABW19_dt0201130 [Dactylella cylindrospora]|nr:hypothetical protein ABW19_dt0201130 [Dactylella cylindrospora]
MRTRSLEMFRPEIGKRVSKDINLPEKNTQQPQIMLSCLDIYVLQVYGLRPRQQLDLIMTACCNLLTHAGCRAERAYYCNLRNDVGPTFGVLTRIMGVHCSF